MAVLSRDDYEFLEINLAGECIPPNPMEIILPESEDPYWEFSYEGGISIFGTGNISVKAQLKEIAKQPDTKEERSQRRRVVALDKVKETEGDAI